MRKHLVRPNDFNGSLLGLGWIIGATMVWSWFIPRPENLALLHGAGWNFYVPDSLLANLADASAVPAQVKTATADALEEDGHITFELLFDIEGWIAEGEARERREKGRGFQKMMDFGSKPTNEE